jgi:hypothetical protein
MSTQAMPRRIFPGAQQLPLMFCHISYRGQSRPESKLPQHERALVLCPHRRFLTDAPCRLVAAVCVAAVAAAVLALCARLGAPLRGRAGAAPARSSRVPPSHLPSQRDISLWCICIMRSARKLSNQTAHLGATSEVCGLGVLHAAQTAGAAAGSAPFAVGPPQPLLAIGRAPENQGQGGHGNEGETCLRCARAACCCMPEPVAHHKAQSTSPLAPSPTAAATMRAARRTSLVLSSTVAAIRAQVGAPRHLCGT